VVRDVIGPEHARMLSSNIMRTAKPPLVIWELTRACSAGCTRCPNGAPPHRNPRELTTYEAYKTIDQIAALGPRELIITGGDPFERRDLEQLIEYARRRGLDPALAVSGTWRLNEGAVRKLSTVRLSRLILPLDASNPWEHERVRGSKKTFPPTLLAARWAHMAGMAVEASTLATPSTLPKLDTLATLLEDMAVDRWNVFLLVPVAGSREVEMMTAAQVEQLFGLLASLHGKVPFRIRTFEAPHFRRFALQHGISDEAVIAADILFINHQGEVAPSAFLPASAGNVRYQPLRRIYTQSPLFATLHEPSLLKGKCASCEYREICGGSRARALAMTGDLFDSDELCAYQPANA
jgi:radical SAM protein with 4Fe4S-binding SPASM domain